VLKQSIKSNWIRERDR